MPKAHTKFVCQQCGYESAKYLGRCPDCGEWNTMVETVIPAARPGGQDRAATLARGGQAVAIPLPQVPTTTSQRLNTGSPELDRVLGGGIVPGPILLIGGEPGIGRCLTADTRVLDTTSGALVPIVAWRDASARRVLSLDEPTQDLSPHAVSAVHEQGIRPIVEVRTRLGRTL